MYLKLHICYQSYCGDVVLFLVYFSLSSTDVSVLSLVGFYETNSSVLTPNNPLAPLAAFTHAIKL